MPQSLAAVYTHIVFATKDRRPLITDLIRPELHAYISQILLSLNCTAACINSVDDHIHILSRLSRTHSIAHVLEEIKKSSSKWIKTKLPSLEKFAWQSGYGIFSVSHSNTEQVKKYINNQQQHHQQQTFQEEYRSLMEKHHITFDERYLWD